MKRLKRGLIMKQSELVKKKVLCLFMVFMLIIIILPLQIFAQNKNQKIVRVGYFQDNDGFQSGFSDSAPKSGYAYEFYQELAKYTGWKYEYVYGSWSDIYQKLVKGEVDIMGGVSKIDERLDDMLFADNIMGVESYYVFVPSNYEAIRAGDPSSLNGKRIGVNDNSYMLMLLKQYTEKNAPKCTIVAYDGTEERMSALSQGKIDGIVTVDNYMINGLKPIFKIGSSDYYFAVNKQRSDILNDLNYAQEKILSNSPYYISTLQKKYFNTSVVRESLTDDEMAWLGKHKQLKLGYLNDCLPYCASDAKTGKLTGMLAEIIPDMERFGTSEITAVGYNTFADLNNALKNEEIDIAFPAGGDIWIAENQDYIQSHPIANDRIAVVYSGEFHDSVYDHIAISDKSSIQPMYISVKYPDAQKTEYDSLKECLHAVKSGRAGSCLVSSNVLFGYIARNEQDPSLHVAYLEDAMDYCFAVRRDSTTLYTILNKAVASVDEVKINNAVIQNANIKAPYTLRSFLKHNMAAVLAFLFLLFLLLILLFVRYRRKTQKNQKQLQEAYEAANKAAEAKTVFLSTMSHDIRTPMNAIINLTALAKEEIDDKEKLTSDLNKIDISNKFLLGLINDILDISKIESGALVLRNTVYSYDRFCDYISSVIEPLCNSKGIHFELKSCLFKGSFYTDEVRFNQIFFNLLSNAVKYSNSGSTVLLRMENEHINGKIISMDFVVEDHGTGMSSEFQKKLFTPFEREYGGDARMGTGLGLAITKRIVDAMGGTISVKSTQGAGTTVRVHLEFEMAADEDASEVTNKPCTCAEKTERVLSGRHVLVAEDHQMNLEIITRILKKCGMKVDAAQDGLKALEAFKNSAVGYYDLILMDIRMPVMNGLEAAKAIRSLKRPDAETVPIIATTAEAFEQEKEEVFNAKMTGHIAKPIDPKQLYTALAEALQNKNDIKE